MNEPHDPNRTVGIPSVPADSLDAGLAAGFGRPAEAPHSSLDASQRPVLLREVEGESAHIVKPNSDAMPDKADTGDRYQLYGEMARGGMGAVLRGRDVDLGRDLAIKVLLEKHANRPDVARRFLEEAQIGGQLQHPGVVPVYDVGHFGDRPFFTMKLVKGQTLAALLSARTDPAADRPRLLNIALQVAQTLAYAHAKGVIHRDLKPANVMVGAFGEVQVMDWGLAKVLAEGGVADEERASRQHQPVEGTQIRTARSSGSAGSGSAGSGTDTEAGSLLGTPAYMPPEQANGDISCVDRRCDVFGLGAILCEILTGKPPYVGRSAEEVRRKAANGNLADATARLDGCGADADLIALAKACLAPEAIDRPKDAREVDDRLSAYLDGVQERLQAAQRERAVAVVRADGEARLRRAAEEKAAEQRRRRQTQLALTAAVVLLMLGGGAFAWWQDRQVGERKAAEAHLAGERDAEARNKEQQARQSVDANLKLANDLRRQYQFKAAEAALAQAGELATGGAPERLPEIEQARRDLAFVVELDGIRYRKWVWISEQGERGHFNAQAAPPEYRRAFAERGLDLLSLDPAEAARRIAVSEVQADLVAAVDDWALHEPEPGVQRLLLEIARRADPGAWTDRLRDPAVRADRVAVQKLAADTDPARTSQAALSVLATLMKRQGLSPAALLSAARASHPADFELAFALGLWHMDRKDGQQIGPFEAARALRPENFAVWTNLGCALYDKRKVDEAIACYQKAIDIEPKIAWAHSNLGSVLCDGKRDYDGAIACFRKAIEIDPKFAVAHTCLGNALRGKKKVEEAIACYQKALKLDPNDACAYNGLGAIFCDVKRNYDEAIACFQTAIEIDPNLAMAHYNLGEALNAKGQVDEAIACWRKAIACRRKAIELDPKLAVYLTNLGLALAGKGQVDEAIACYQKAIESDPNLAAAHNNLGVALYRKGRVDEAIASHEKFIELEPKLARAHTNLGIVLSGKGKEEEAMACFKKAIELDSKEAKAHSGLGLALWRKGQVDEAIACYQKAIEIEPTLALAHYNLGNALKGKGKVDEAIVCYRKAIELDSKDAKAHYALGNALGSKGQVDEAIACWRKAIACYQKPIEIEPTLAKAHYILGLALSGKGQVDEAIACYQKAIESDPKLANAHSGLGFALADKGKVEDAIACFQKAIEIDPTLARAHCGLGNALSGKSQVDEAIACYQKALKLDPNLAQAHYGLGLALRDKGRVDEAIDELRKFIKLDPKSAVAYYYLGLTLKDKADLDGAERAFREAVRLDGEHHGAAIDALAEMLLSRGNMKEAVATYQKITMLKPDSADTLNKLAWLLATCSDAKLRNPQQAVTLAKKAVALDPKQGNSWNTLGVAHFRAGDAKAAIAPLLISMELRQGGDASDEFFLAMAHWQLGAKDKALESYDRAVKWMDTHQPKNEELRRIQAEASQLLEVKEKK